MFNFWQKKNIALQKKQSSAYCLWSMLCQIMKLASVTLSSTEKRHGMLGVRCFRHSFQEISFFPTIFAE